MLKEGRKHSPSTFSFRQTLWQVKSSHFICTAQNHTFASGGFTSQSVQYTTPSVLRPLQRIRKNSQKTLNREKMEESSGRKISNQH